jgi:hypothetical protein
LPALTIVAWVLNAKLGGNATVWRSRFASFIRGSGKLLRSLSGQLRADERHALDHSAPGGLPVFVLLGFLALRVAGLEAE